MNVVYMYTIVDTCYHKSSCKRFHTGEPAGPAVIDGVGRHQEGEEPGVGPLHLREGGGVQLGPGAVDHGYPSR